MSNKISRKTLIILSSMALTILVTLPAYADTTDSLGKVNGSRKLGHQNGGIRGSMHGVVGTVTSISGNTITVSGKNSTTYSVDATSAKITKDKSTAMSIADVKIGDMIMVKGKISGTSVVATVIRDGIPASRGEGLKNFPGVRGTVTALNGSIITITNEKGVVYSIDATNAVINKGGINKKPATVTINDIANGDTLMVLGAVNGNSVTAEKIFDGKIKAKVIRNKNK